MKKGYVQTDVGIIPDDWTLSPMGNIGKAIIGLTYSPRNVSSYGKLVHRSSNIQENKLAYDDNVYVNVEIDEKLILKENDILICVRNGSRDLIGKSALISGKSIGETFGAFMSVFRTNYNASFIYQLFISNVIQKQINESLGATINQITNKTINEFKIPLPPTKAEQTSIATALNDADALITSLEKLIEKKRAIKQGAMQELLRPNEGWEVKKLGEIGKCHRGVSYNPERDLYPYDTDITVRLLRSNNIQNRNLDLNNLQFVDRAIVKSNQILQNNDIVICMANGSKQLVGKSTIYNDKDNNKYTFGAFMGCFRIDENLASSSFVAVTFQSFQYRSYIDVLLSGSSINNLNPSNIESIDIPFPSWEEQVRIATILGELDAEIAGLEQKRGKYKLIKQGMMQELLTGRIRLI